MATYLAIKEAVETLDMLIDCVIRSIEANSVQLSGVLAKEAPYLLRDGV